MILLAGLVVAAFLVGLGYLNLWTAGRPGTMPGLARFGRILAIVLFALAGLTLVAPAAGIPFRLARRAWKHAGWHHGLFGKTGECDEHGGRGSKKWRRRGRAGDLDTDELEDRAWELMDDFMVDEGYEETIDNLEDRVELLEAKVYGQ